MYKNSERTAGFIEWLGTEPLCRFTICSNCEPLEPNELLEVIEKLESVGFYELITVILIRNEVSSIGERVISRFISSAIAEKIRHDGASKSCSEIKSILREECKKKHK